MNNAVDIGSTTSQSDDCTWQPRTLEPNYDSGPEKLLI